MKLSFIHALTTAVTLFVVDAYACPCGRYSSPVSIAEVEVLPDNTNFVQVIFNATLSTPNGCSNTAYKDRLVFDSTTAQGKTYLTMVMAAYLSGRKVRADGTGTCPPGIPVEQLRWFDFLSS